MRFSMFSAQFTTLCYHSTNWLAGLNLNIAFNVRECFRFTNLCHSTHDPSLKCSLLLYKEFHVKLFEFLIILFCLKQTLLKDEKAATVLQDVCHKPPNRARLCSVYVVIGLYISQVTLQDSRAAVLLVEGRASLSPACYYLLLHCFCIESLYSHSRESHQVFP
jgi:hypothetical protein